MKQKNEAPVCIKIYMRVWFLSEEYFSFFYPLVKHDKYSADSITNIMTRDVIINTKVNIDEVLELENQQQDVQAVCLVCSIKQLIT